jgi:hypothetical protein
MNKHILFSHPSLTFIIQPVTRVFQLTRINVMCQNNKYIVAMEVSGLVLGGTKMNENKTIILLTFANLSL